MSTSESRRRQRASAGASEAPESMSPPRRKPHRGELDPEALWDSDASESSESRESSDDDDSDDELERDDGTLDEIEEGNLDAWDDWDHPLRGLKVD